MEEVYLRDRGGIQPDAADVLSDDLVMYLDGINTTLGTEQDPRFGEYQEFLNSISEASILRIEPEQMSSGKYDGLDLTGGEDDAIIIEEPDETDLFGENLALLATMQFATPFTQGKGIDEYAPLMNWVYPEFTDA